MLKFLRKYNKWILVIGGSLLMVAFLMPNVIQRLGANPMRRVVARLGTEKVTWGQQIAAARELDALASFAPTLVSVVVEDRNPDHWMLLVREAERGGYVGVGGDGVDWISDLARFEANRLVLEQLQQQFGPAAANFLFDLPDTLRRRQQAADQLANDMMRNRGRIAARSGLSEAEFDLALSRLRGVVRMVEAYHQLARISEPRARSAARLAHDLLYLDALVLGADLLLDQIDPPDDQALQDHFDRYRDQLPGTGQFGMGYRQPPRVRLAYLTLDREAISNAIPLDPVEVRKRWSRQRERYGESWDEARPAVERDLRRELTDAALESARRTIRAEIMRVTRTLEEVDGYFVLPDDWNQRQPHLEQIAQRVVETVRRDASVDIPLPPVHVLAGDWLTADALARLEGIGRSTVRFGARAISFPDAVMSVRELGGGPVRVQVGVPAVDLPARDARGNEYYFVVLEARPESPPASLEEVRDQIERDVRRLAAFHRLEARLDELLRLAIDDSLDAVATHFAVTTGSESPPADGATPSDEPDADAAPTVLRRVAVRRDRVESSEARLNSAVFRERAFELAASFDPAVPVDQLDAAARTFAVALPDSLSIAVARIVAYRPLTIERYRQVVHEVATSLQMRELAETGRLPDDNPYSFARLSERLRFRPVGRTSIESADDAG